MRYTKPPLTFDEQVDLLIKRGLQIDDRERALRWLRRVSYYRLSAYFLPFKIRDTDAYRKGASFDSVLALYKFDAKLRLLILQAIERVEVAIRTAITYEMAHQLGPFGYSNPENFSPTFNHAKLLDTIREEVGRSKETFVSHFRIKYHEEPFLPVWMVTECIPFGSLSMVYGGLKRNLQKRIADHFRVPEGAFKSWLHTLNYVRNACAHHNRLWNRKLAISPSLPPTWRYLTPRPDRVYAVLQIIQSMITTIAPECRWKDRIMILVLSHPTLNTAAMGFPVNWKELPPWDVSPL